jgi:hypothetical protein
MTRNGKIARLPFEIREEVNRRLRDNVPGPKICEWVNRLPECKKVCAEFARRGGNAKSPVTVSQVSEWRRGGFQDWLREQAVLDETRELRQWCAQLAGNGGDLTESVATLLSGQLLKLVQGLDQLRIAECGVRNGGRRVTRRASFGVRGHVRALKSGDMSPQSKGRSCSSVGRESCDRTVHPVDAGEMEQTEWAVRVLGGLVKCLSGIRRGDQNRVRLEQSERKLALRSKLAAIKLEKYEKEKAEQEELERKKRADERRRKCSALSDRGKIDLLRARMFGPEDVIQQKEEQIKEMQKDLEILKKKFDMDEDSADDGETEESNGGSATGNQDVGCEQMRVDTSACECEPHGQSKPESEDGPFPGAQQGQCS